MYAYLEYRCPEDGASVNSVARDGFHPNAYVWDRDREMTLVSKGLLYAKETHAELARGQWRACCG